MAQPIEDIVMKGVMELFKGDALQFFGIDKRIVSATAISAEARTELAHIHVQRNIDDWLLEAEDGSFIHVEFQSSYDKKDLVRFMVSDAILYAKAGKRIQSIVVYSANVLESETKLDAGSIQYSADAFYMAALDGDKTFADITKKVSSGASLTKQDLMSIVFLPLMKNSVDKPKRFEQAAKFTKAIMDKDIQLQIQAMIGLLAEKFLDPAKLKEVKEMMFVGLLVDMMRAGEMKEGVMAGLINGLTQGTKEELIQSLLQNMAKGKQEGKVEVAKNLLAKGLTAAFVSETTGLDEAEIRNIAEGLNIA